MSTILTLAFTHLLTLPDPPQGTLAEFDYCADEALLRVCWCGHLTAERVVHGAQTALQLSATRTVRRVLNDKSGSSGSWEEALPWFHYDWLPQAVAGGVRALAYVLPPDSQGWPAAEEFLRFARQQLAISLFRSRATALQWLLRQPG